MKMEKFQHALLSVLHIHCPLWVFVFLLLPLLCRCENNVYHVNPFRSYVGPRPTWFSSSAPMSGDVRHFFCCVCAPAPLSEPFRHFSSCTTDFSQQIAQVILFLFHGSYAVGRKTGWERVKCFESLPSSDLDWKIGCYDWGFSCFSSLSSCGYWRGTSE